ncbi:hypothetical protein GCM10009771_24160 [Nesterenkonia flava]
MDAALGELTLQAAATVDEEYAEGMNILMNYWFILVSTFVLAITGTLVSRYVVEPRLGDWHGEGAAAEEDRAAMTITSLEKKGLIAAGIALVVSVAAMLLLIIPENAPLRGEGGAIVQSPFMDPLAVVIIAVFFVPGLVHGIVTKVVRNDTDAVNHLSKTLAGMAMFLVLAFTAGQFIAYFTQSNLGQIVAVLGGDALEAINLNGFLLVLVFMLFVAVVNLFVGSASAKWALLAPIMVPIMMHLGLSPELTQASYRVSDSATNILSPLLPYFAIIIVAAQRYDKRLGIGSLISVMLPYAIAFMAVWSVMTLGWMGLDLPLGPNAPIYYEGR